MGLASELSAANPTRLFLTIDKVEAVDPAGKVLASLSGTTLATWWSQRAATRHSPPAALPEIFVDVALAAGSPLPLQVHPASRSRASWPTQRETCGVPCE